MFEESDNNFLRMHGQELEFSARGDDLELQGSVDTIMFSQMTMKESQNSPGSYTKYENDYRIFLRQNYNLKRMTKREMGEVILKMCSTYKYDQKNVKISKIGQQGLLSSTLSRYGGIITTTALLFKYIFDCELNAGDSLASGYFAFFLILLLILCESINLKGISLLQEAIQSELQLKSFGISKEGYKLLCQNNIVFNYFLDTLGLTLQFALLIYFLASDQISLIYFVLWVGNLCTSMINHYVTAQELKVAKELLRITEIEEEKDGILLAIKSYLLKRVYILKQKDFMTLKVNQCILTLYEVQLSLMKRAQRAYILRVLQNYILDTFNKYFLVCVKTPEMPSISNSKYKENFEKYVDLWQGLEKMTSRMIKNQSINKLDTDEN